MISKFSIGVPLAVGLAVLVIGSPGSARTEGGERQLTASSISKFLDNNDNFSRDDRYLVFDTRDTPGGGILKVSTTTGVEMQLYPPPAPAKAAPVLRAPSYSPIADEVAFIHGPLMSEVVELGAYGPTNRRGGVAKGDGSGEIRFLDCRDVKSDVTPRGALRGGTHRHEYTADGKRVGFTYDDALFPQYGRTIGYMIQHPKAPCGASHWACILLSVVPPAESKPGDLERAADDSWVGAAGLMRGFIGNVKETDGKVTPSLFVVDVPANVDITTGDSGSKTRHMAPPAGVRIRRLTNTRAFGIVRGSLDGTRIGYFANASDGSRQAFVINSLGSDQSKDPQMKPIQVSNLPHGTAGGLRWHPSGNSIAVQSDNGVVAICVKPGAQFGKTQWLTKHGTGVPAAVALVWSRDGTRLAFNRRVNDFQQIFMVDFPDANGDGIADGVQ